jgi:hypothetical protein
MTLFSVALWAVEALLAILTLWLIHFAFSQPPRFIPIHGESTVARPHQAS